MGKWQAYQAYADSGVSTLGEIPASWTAKPLKVLSTYNDEVLTESTDPEFSIEYVDISSVSATEGIKETTTMNFGSAPSRARRTVRDGDVLVSTVRTYLEAIAWIANPPENMIASTGFAVVRAKPSLLDRRFAGYALRARYFIDEVVSRSVGVSYPAINASDLVSIKVPVPAIDEQATIAAFLDHETARIDRLIARQERLVELLKEKRQAVISHAVTKGLNPDAPMKDSGVEWLGQVPAHWVVGALKFGWDVIDCKHLTAPFVDDGIPLASIREVQSRVVDLSEAKKTTREYYLRLIEGGRKPRAGDIIYSRNATVGEAALVVDGPEFAMGQDVALMRPKHQDSDYFLYQLESKSIASQLDLLMVGATFKRINVGDIKNLLVVYPPLDVQRQIARHLKEIESRFDRLSACAVCAVELLREHRTALISAAVTGKIDVRNWQKPNNEPQAAASAATV